MDFESLFQSNIPNCDKKRVSYETCFNNWYETVVVNKDQTKSGSNCDEFFNVRELLFYLFFFFHFNSIGI